MDLVENPLSCSTNLMNLGQIHRFGGHGGARSVWLTKLDLNMFLVNVEPVELYQTSPDPKVVVAAHHPSSYINVVNS